MPGKAKTPIADLRRSLFDWDDLQAFYAVSETGSFSRAAAVLGRRQPTISASISRLEDRLGAKLFDRGPKGAMLTPIGVDVFDKVKSIYHLAIDIEHSATGDDRKEKGQVRISCSEGLASFWIAPRLADFYASNPDIQLDIHIGDDPVNITTKSVDLAVYFDNSKNMDAIATPLGGMHYMLFATRTFANRYGLPKNLNDIMNYRLLTTASRNQEDAWSPETRSMDDYVRQLVGYGLEVDSSAMMFNAFYFGAGLAMVPTFMVADSARLGYDPEEFILLDYGVRQSIKFWLVFHRERADVARVRRVVDWMKEIFSEPCFRDEFIHPAKFSDIRVETPSR